MQSDLEFTIDELSFLCGVVLSEIVKCRDKNSDYYDTLRRLSVKIDKYRNYLKTLRESPIGDLQAPVAEKNTELEDIKRTVNELTEAVKRLEKRNDELGQAIEKLTQNTVVITPYDRTLW